MKLKKKIVLLPLILFIALPSIFAIDFLCTDMRATNQNCTILTPALNNCTIYDYQIINMSGSVVQTTNLTNLYGDIYYLNWSLPNGEYIIRLCDGSTKEINFTDEEGTNMIVAIIILLPMILSIVLVFIANGLGKEHTPLKIGFMLMSLVAFLLSLYFAGLSIIKFYNWSEMQEAIGFTTNWYAWILVFIVFYIILYLIILLTSYIRGKKEEPKY